MAENACYDIISRFISGLIEIESKTETLHFFQAIEREPCCHGLGS